MGTTLRIGRRSRDYLHADGVTTQVVVVSVCLSVGNACMLCTTVESKHYYTGDEGIALHKPVEVAWLSGFSLADLVALLTGEYDGRESMHDKG